MSDHVDVAIQKHSECKAELNYHQPHSLYTVCVFLMHCVPKICLIRSIFIVSIEFTAHNYVIQRSERNKWEKVRLNVIIPCTSVRLWWYMHISSHAVCKFSTPLCIMKSFTINCSLELATTIIICLSSNMDVWRLHLWRLLLSEYKVCSASDSMWKLLREFLTIHSNCFCLPIIRPCYLNANPYEITKTRHGQEIYDVPSDWSHKKSQTVFWLCQKFNQSQKPKWLPSWSFHWHSYSLVRW